MIAGEADARCALYAAAALGSGAPTASTTSTPKPKMAKAAAASAAPSTAPSTSGGLSDAELERRFQLMRSVGEECVTEADLRQLLSKKPAFRLYDGFEPSGRMHIAQGIFKALNVNKCTQAGGTFVFWVADWFALMNDKMGGDLEKIKVVGQYFIEVWKGAGMDLSNVEFRWASEDIIGNAAPYWDQMLDIAKRFTVARIKKCCQIMGRLEDSLTAAQILYPLMQCADVFFLQADVCQLGVDQRKVNMLAREYCDAIGRKLKPVILSHHMLYGLAEGQAKMSKSNPDSAIFMEDTAEEVERKMNIAFCPREQTPSAAGAAAAAATTDDDDGMHLVADDLKNPCLDYAEHIVMSQPGAEFVARSKTYATFPEVRAAFLDGSLSEQDLKAALVARINDLMQPVRDHFANDAHAAHVLALVKQYKREAAQPPSRLKRMSKACRPGEAVAVFAPPPPAAWAATGAATAASEAAGSLPLGDVLGTAQAVRAARVEAKGAARVLLVVPDLDAVALGCFGGDKKLKASECVAAHYEALVAAVGALVEGGAGSLEVVKQSALMLQDPSDFWVSVINVGRRFQLRDVLDALGDDASLAGAVVAALMHVGTVLAVAPRVVFTATAEQEALHALAARYISECSTQQDAFPEPRIDALAPVSSVTTAPDAATPAVLMLLDDAAAVKRKIKQAFCEPGNADANPPLALIEHLALARGVPVTLKLEAGGDRTYTDAQSLREDFASGQLHPGDLKAALQPVAEKAMKELQAALKPVDKSVKLLQSFAKRAGKN